MKKCNCECCGAGLPIPKIYDKYVKCEYCGATYKIEDQIEFPEVKYFLIQPGHIQRVGAQVVVPQEYLEYMPEEEMMSYIKKELTNEIAKNIFPYLKIKEDFDFRNFNKIFKAFVRIDTSSF